MFNPVPHQPLRYKIPRPPPSDLIRHCRNHGHHGGPEVQDGETRGEGLNARVRTTIGG